MSELFNPIVFGDLVAILADVHMIDDRHRTKFQARLKNLHRLHWPLSFHSVKGKASTYSPGEVVDMALAVELTQLGLSPERIVHVLVSERFPTLMAYGLAASALIKRPEGGMRITSGGYWDRDPDANLPESTFIYFDPSGLDSLSSNAAQMSLELDSAKNSFFYGGSGVIRDNLADWTYGHTSRMSLVNITSMMDVTTCSPFDFGTPDDLEYRKKYFEWIAAWAERSIDRLLGSDETEANYAIRVLQYHNVETAMDLARLMAIPLDRAQIYFAAWD